MNMKPISGVVLSLLLVGCGPRRGGDAASSALTVAVSLDVERGGAWVHVPEGGVVRSNELIRIEVTPSQTAFLYVIQQRPGGQVDLLVPLEGEHVAYPGGIPVLMPPDGADYRLRLDSDPGEETLLVIAAPAPIGDLDAAAAEIVGVARSGGVVEAEPAEPVLVDAGVVDPAPDAGVAPVVAPIAPPDAAPAADPPARSSKRVAKAGQPRRCQQMPRPKGGFTSAGVGHPLTCRGVIRELLVDAVVVAADPDGVVVYPYGFTHQ